MTSAGHIPLLQVGIALDERTYLLIHEAPARTAPGFGATPVGDIDRIARDQFRQACRDLILASLDAFALRIAPRPSEVERLGRRANEASTARIAWCPPSLVVRGRPVTSWISAPTTCGPTATSTAATRRTA
jgi:hypothetical protein